EVLQQVAVVARDLDHPAVRAEAEAPDHELAVLTRMLHPALRIGGEIRVFAEDALRRYELLELYEVAALADVGVQRIVGLHRPELLAGDVGLTQGRHAQVDEGVLQRMAAEATGRHARHSVSTDLLTIVGCHLHRRRRACADIAPYARAVAG